VTQVTINYKDERHEQDETNNVWNRYKTVLNKFDFIILFFLYIKKMGLPLSFSLSL
jgi:uncharacterized protein YutD